VQRLEGLQCYWPPLPTDIGGAENAELENNRLENGLLYCFEDVRE